MSWIWIGVAVAGVALLARLGLGVWLMRNFEWCSTTTVEPSPAIDLEDMEPLIKDAAERWATAHRRPEAAGLVADKLRTLYDITYCKLAIPPRYRWWSW